MRVLLPALSLLFFSRLAPAGNVLVVDASGTGYTDIAPAINAAADHDVVLVKGGDYSGFTIVDKSISVVADVGQLVQVHGNVAVRNLAASRDVVLGGLQIFGMSTAAGFPLHLKSDAGGVRLYGCTVQGFLHAGGAWIEDSPDVAITGTTIAGGSGIPGLQNGDANAIGAVGSYASSARVALYDSNVIGGSGTMTSCFGSAGGDAVRLFDSYLFAGTLYTHAGYGGSAANTCFANCDGCTCDGGNGGDGLVLLDPGARPPSRCDALMSEFHGATGGIGGDIHHCCCCGIFASCHGANGYTGPDLDVGSGIYSPLPGMQPHFSASQNPAREQSNETLTFMGAPGDEVYLLLNDAATFVPSTVFKGVRLVARAGQPYVAILGATDASGVLQVDFTIPELGQGVQGRVVHLQSLHRNAAGEFALGNSMQLVMLDRAF